MAGKSSRFLVGRWQRAFLALVLVSSVGISLRSLAGTAETDSGLSVESAEAAAHKLRQVREGSRAGRPFGSVRISEVEANSYLHYELASSFPAGVSNVRLAFQPNRPRGTAEVDFDRIKETRSSPPNPFLAYFLTGVHTIAVEGTLYGSNGVGQFHLESVSMDGVTLPPMVVDFLIEHYLKARYPSASVDQSFRLPASIAKLSVEEGSLVVVSRPPQLD